MLPEQRGRDRHDQERRDHHRADDAAAEELAVEQQRDAEPEHQADQHDRRRSAGSWCRPRCSVVRVGEDPLEVVEAGEADLARGGCAFQFRNEMTSVATNGSWVTMIMKTSAGSSGARRTHASCPARRSARVARWSTALAVSAVVLRSCHALAPPARWPARPGECCTVGHGPAATSPGLGGLLLLVAGGLARPSDPGSAPRRPLVCPAIAALMSWRHLVPEVGELRDVDELDAGRRAAAARPGWPGRRVSIASSVGSANARGDLQVVRVRVGRGALAGRDAWPSRRCCADQVLVVLARGPGDELPGVVLVLGGLLDRPRPGVEPAGALGLLDRRRDVADLALDRGVRRPRASRRPRSRRTTSRPCPAAWRSGTR